MQISKKLQPHQQNHMNHRNENGKHSPLQLQQQAQRCTMKSNVVIILIVLFFIAATTLIQLPTMNYIAYLTNSGNESQFVKVKPFIPSYEHETIPPKRPTKSSSSSVSGNTNSEEEIDDDNDEDDDSEKGDDESNNNDEENVDTTKAKKVEAAEEPDDGGDDDHATIVVDNSGEKEEATNKSTSEGESDDDKEDDGNAASGNAILPPDDAPTNNEDQDDADDPQNDNEPHWEKDLSPKIVWLASYPNSGTSYTMTLVERASNFSTATNYGNEVTHPKYDSIPIYPNHEEGPFWEGTSEHAIQLNRVIRNLPTTYVLTKTHCGGRCIKCPASEYMVNTTRQFIYGCQKTSYRKNSHMVTTEHGAPLSSIKKVLHLIRNPYHNVVARFHLERKNMIAKDSSYEQSFTYDATGFQNYCTYLDNEFNYEDKKLLPSKLYKKYFNPKSDDFIPCAAEFYKWAQWHNYVVQSSVLLGLKSDRTEQIEIETDFDGSTTKDQLPSIPVHVIWYENYELDFNATFNSIMDFLQLPIATEQIRTFRALPTYNDHFTTEQRTNVQAMIQKVAIPSTWTLIKHYFD